MSTLIEKLGEEGAPLARGLVEQLGFMYGGLVEAEQEGNNSEVWTTLAMTCCWELHCRLGS